jgi:short-subunit dehydrogenase
MGVRVMALCPGATATRCFETANPSTEFMARRQPPAQVADFALRKFARGRLPSVVPGLANRLTASCYRFIPRR